MVSFPSRPAAPALRAGAAAPAQHKTTPTQKIGQTPAGSSSLLFTIGGLGLIAELVLLAIALRRSRTTPTWAAVGIVLGAVITSGPSLGEQQHTRDREHDVLLLAALGRIGWLVAADSATDRRHAVQPRD